MTGNWKSLSSGGGLALLVALGAFAAHAATLEDAQRYQTCLDALDPRPSVALEQSLAWKHEGGGAAALHCQALALLAMGQEQDAAKTLESAALSPDAGGPLERAALLAQAGNAWLLADRPEQANVVLTSALGLDPGNVDLMIDRAQAAILNGDWTAAIGDLSAALAVDGQNVTALILRATARRYASDLAGAEADIAQALKLEPDNVEALVEQGRQREQAAGRGD